MAIKSRYLNVKELYATGKFPLKPHSLRQYLSRGEFAKFRMGNYYYLYCKELVDTLNKILEKTRGGKKLEK